MIKRTFKRMFKKVLGTHLLASKKRQYVWTRHKGFYLNRAFGGNSNYCHSGGNAITGSFSSKGKGEAGGLYE